MSVTDDRTETTCLHCGEQVELYAPGESFVGRESEAMHIRCAAIVEADSHAKPYGVCNAEITAGGICRCCKRYAYDCRCPSLQCLNCDLNPEEAHFVDPTKCEYDTKGEHLWLSKEERA